MATSEIISALVNMGSAGAVILVVMIFLKSIKERDAEWRSFFTELNTSNRNDIADITRLVDRMNTTLDIHDRQTKEVYQLIMNHKLLKE